MIKLAVLSDIHGNWPALQAVAADIDGWGPDVVLVNGDVVNDGPSNLACWRYVARRRADPSVGVEVQELERAEVEAGLVEARAQASQHERQRRGHLVLGEPDPVDPQERIAAPVHDERGALLDHHGAGGAAERQRPGEGATRQHLEDHREANVLHGGDGADDCRVGAGGDRRAAGQCAGGVRGRGIGKKCVGAAPLMRLRKSPKMR